MDLNVLFPDKRETGETLTRQCQLVMLRMLKIFDHLCTKHKIQYFLTGGTMLGAVRHDGFIPWDDDLDVGMKRSEYEKFVKLAAPELPNDIFFQTDETDPNYPSCHLMEAKLRDKYSRYCAKPKPWHNGLQIDISIYDRAYLPSNYWIFKQNYILKGLLKKKDDRERAKVMQFLDKYVSLPTGDRARAKVLKFIDRYVPLPLVYSCSFISQPKMVKLGINYIRPDEISKLMRVKFEDMETWIPAGYDGYLKRRYGNYMELPPAYRQKGHHSNSNYLQIFSENDAVAHDPNHPQPDPFTPCEHSETLHWKRKIPMVL